MTVLVSSVDLSQEKLHQSISEMLATGRAVATSEVQVAQGTYLGQKKIVSLDIHASVTIRTNSLEFSVHSKNPQITVECKNEPFTVSDNGDILLTNIKTKGNCVKKELHQQKLALTALKYEAGTINVEVKYAKMFPASIPLFPQAPAGSGENPPPPPAPAVWKKWCFY